VQHQVECARDFIALQRYFAGHLEARRQRPGDDLLSLLVPESMGGTAPLSHQEAVSNAIGLLAAGHETTTDLIGNGLWLLLHSPEQLRALREDSSLFPNAIEEMLRMEAPVRCFFRKTTRETQVGGVCIPRGERVLVVYASGNRDEAQFAMPDRFDIRREEAKRHLSFGKGIHFCLGSILARLEGRIAFEHLLRRLPNLRLAPGGRAVRRPYFILRGFEHLSLTWDLPAA
jgi:cytochrome P450